MRESECFFTESCLSRGVIHEKTSTAHHTAKICREKRQFQKAQQRAKRLRQQALSEQKRQDKELIYQLYTTITHHFPRLFEWMRAMDEVRKKASDYELAAHLTACLAMYLFKLGSRNGWNQKRKKLQFQRNYKKLFGFSMPHGDSVNAVIRLLDEAQVEQLKQTMVKALLERKVFRSQRYRNQWYRIAIDGSGVVSFDHPHCEQCLHKSSKNGKVTYSHQVLDARLVTPNGFSLSMASEWVENPACGEYDKQDCERKAFQRLAVRLKQAFPRLPILILADGLYPYEGFFAACRAQGWAFCTTFKEGSLKSLWEEVHGLQPLQSGQHRTEVRYLPGGKKLTQHYQWVTQLEYQNHPLYWLACEETITWTESQTDGTEVSKTQQVRFVHITSLPVHRDNVVSLSATGRLRWKVENEGFNTLKNGGYAMEHKWSRNSYRALKNYFQFMQMAHLIHQLMLKRDTFVQTWLKGDNHPTVKSLWDDLLGAMQWSKVKLKKLRKILQTPIQFRLLS